jgi:hypothetical protein
VPGRGSRGSTGGQALKEAGLDGKGIGLHTLRSAAISLYAARGLTMLETATVMGQSDSHVTWKHYARLFDPTDVAKRYEQHKSPSSWRGGRW